MRGSLVIMALVATALVGWLFWLPTVPSVPRVQESGGIRPPAPSAAEEAGELGLSKSAEPPARLQALPRTRRGNHTDPAKAPDAAVPTLPTLPGPAEPFRDDVTAPLQSPAGAQWPDVDNRESVMPIERTSSPASAPVLTPPTLMTRGGLQYLHEAYRIELDTGQVPTGVRVELPQGRVVLRVLVRADGSVATVEVAESSGVLSLDTAAVRAAVSWRFVPATRDGQAIDAWALIPVRFVVR